MPDKRILYLGLDPQRWPAEGTLIHYPVIQTQRLDSLEVQRALQLWPQFTHVIFTSRSAVRHWWEVKDNFDKQAIAIGEGTAMELRLRGVEPLVAPEAIQEGVISLLEAMTLRVCGQSLRDSFLFFPHSKRARSALLEYLTKRGISFFSLDLYDTIFQKPEPVPSLDTIQEIVFTSPSTVDGFLQIFGSLPKNIRLTAIGPITRNYLDLYIFESTSFSFHQS